MLLNEARIKAAVIDRLFADGLLTDAVLINEMVVADWARRADLAVIGGKFIAFEVKSDFDTLRRLEGQAITFLTQFDKVIVVTTDRFKQQALSMLPSEVGVWVASVGKDDINVKVARAGKTSQVRAVGALCNFLTKVELITFLRRQKRSLAFDVSRSELIEMAKSCSIKALRDYIAVSLKKRYRETFAAFVQQRAGRNTQPIDIETLSKSKLLLREYQQQAIVNSQSKRERRPEHAIPIDKEYLIKLFGNVPEGMPTYILPRKKISST